MSRRTTAWSIGTGVRHSLWPSSRNKPTALLTGADLARRVYRHERYNDKRIYAHQDDDDDDYESLGEETNVEQLLALQQQRKRR